MTKGKYSFVRKGQISDAVCDEAKPGYKAGNPLLDQNYEEFAKELVNKIKKVQQHYVSLIRDALPSIDKGIEEIIKNKSKDKVKIEHFLDDLLDFVNFGQGEKELNRLLRYYKKVDKKGHDFYLREYQKIKDET